MKERPLEIRQLDALKDWLRDGPWTVREAACLLAGVLPPERRGDSSDFGGWLPGREAWAFLPHMREAEREIVAADIAHIEKVLRENGPPKGAEPQDFLSLASRLKIIPPWLDAARTDPDCAELLPTALQPKSARSWQSPPAKGGSTRPDAEVVALFMCDVLRDGRTSAEVFRLFEKHKADWNLAMGQSTVRRWCNTDLKDTSADDLLLIAGNPPGDVARLKAEAMRMLAEKSLDRLTSAR